MNTSIYLYHRCMRLVLVNNRLFDCIYFKPNLAFQKINIVFKKHALINSMEFYTGC